MAHFGIQVSPLAEQIHIGLLDRTGTMFINGEDIIDPDDEESVQAGMADRLAQLHHEDHTDRTLRVVSEYVLQHFGGALSVDYKDGARFEITVTRTDTSTTGKT